MDGNYSQLHVLNISNYTLSDAFKSQVKPSKKIEFKYQRGSSGYGSHATSMVAGHYFYDLNGRATGAGSSTAASSDHSEDSKALDHHHRGPAARIWQSSPLIMSLDCSAERTGLNSTPEIELNANFILFIRHVFPAGVNTPCLNFADKTVYLQCSPTARYNVHEGFDPTLVRHCIIYNMGDGEDKWEHFLAVVNVEDSLSMQLTAFDSINNKEDIMVEPSKLIAKLTKIGAIGTKGTPTVHQGMHECLEIIDWATHKFTADALVVVAPYSGQVISNGNYPIFEPLKACSFDKVKPVRGGMMETLHVWRKISDKGDTAVPEASMERKVANFGNNENKIFDLVICLLQPLCQYCVST
ncbi:Microtubule-associated protein SPIRAL2-like [Dendrobium catenatum]|uniref:Microtubule-associated protein SPIRAL2-like n=1 Tax=Dendrobium catenatum TaxID=906689 RepID=A0A2I0V751_9ASPA|nr:Microtubule-associated protein SPIRAL2-like [Dendrobium catenatum]